MQWVLSSQLESSWAFERDEVRATCIGARRRAATGDGRVPHRAACVMTHYRLRVTAKRYSRGRALHRAVRGAGVRASTTTESRHGCDNEDMFYQPHSALQLPNGDLMLIDDGNNRPGCFEDVTKFCFSRAIVYRFDTANRTARVAWQARRRGRPSPTAGYDCGDGCGARAGARLAIDRAMPPTS